MITETVRNYMLKCPQLSGKKININCLGTKYGSFSLDNIPSEPVIKIYCDGEALKQAVFALAVRGKFDENLNDSKEIIKLLEEVEEWIFRQNTAKNLPMFEQKGIICRGIEVTKGSYLHDTSMSSGRWQMEFRIVYRQMV